VTNQQKKYIGVGLLSCLLLFSSCAQPVSIESGNKGNQNPIIRSITAEPNPVRVGNVCEITAVAEDPQGSPLTYQWYASIGDLTGSGNQVRYLANYCCAGSVKITVIVRNNLGGSSMQSFFINVLN